MFRSTSVVITTMRAPEFTFVSPVRRPTSAGPHSSASSWYFWLLSALIGVV